MSQTLLGAIGVVVFAITLVASLLYGFFKLGQIYDTGVVEEATYIALHEEIEVDVALGSAVPASSLL